MVLANAAHQPISHGLLSGESQMDRSIGLAVPAKSTGLPPHAWSSVPVAEGVEDGVHDIGKPGVPVPHELSTHANGLRSVLVRDGIVADHQRSAYPRGESWVMAMERVSWFVDDVALRWNGERVLVIGHIATLRGLAHHIDGITLTDIRSVSDPWRQGWEFRLAQ